MNIWPIMERMQGDIAAQIRILLGEEAYDQRIFTDAERLRRMAILSLVATTLAADDTATSDEERHESWCKMHIERGWKYGEKFDPANKLHPNLLPWDKLPASVRVKAKIFEIISKAGRDIEQQVTQHGQTQKG